MFHSLNFAELIVSLYTSAAFFQSIVKLMIYATSLIHKTTKNEENRERSGGCLAKLQQKIVLGKCNRKSLR